MKLFRYVFGAFAVLAVSFFASRVDAQEHEHLQVGVFADYFDTSQTSTWAAVSPCRFVGGSS